MITRFVVPITRIVITLLFVGGAVIGVGAVWYHYEIQPWTRDGRVRADVVQVASDVSGLVTNVMVHDNQAVHAGDILFQVDRDRYAAALAQADAAVARAQATLDDAQRQAQRYGGLGSLVASEVKDQRSTAAQQATAGLQQAQADQRVAKINLDRADVRARVDGYVTNFGLRPGDYVSVGTPLFAVVDTNSYYVLGYFEETKLQRFQLGDRARVTLMGDTRPIWGHVVSIAAGIADREENPSASRLPDVTPTFSWIRLAQRVPVRIVIDSIPPGMRLIAGRTASVTVLPKLGRVPLGASSTAIPFDATYTAPQVRGDAAGSPLAPQAVTIQPNAPDATAGKPGAVHQ